MPPTLRFVLSFFAAALCAFAQKEQGHRLALVIGNSNYEHLPRVEAATADADLMSAALTKGGFEVTAVHDFRHPDFLHNVEPAFLGKVRPGDTCFIYYSGYSVQVFGDTLLLPVNFDPAAKGQMTERAYALMRLPQVLQDDKKSGIKIVVVEASRPIRAPLDIPGLVSTAPGAPDLGDLRQALFAFPTHAGQTVPPTAGGASLFTKAVAAAIVKPGADIKDAFFQAQSEVDKETGGSQVPEIDTTITTSLVLVAAPPPPPPKEKIVVIESRPAGFPAQNSRDREEYVWIPPGKFQMGCVPKDTRCRPDEKPQHEVTISHGFWMGRNEVQVVSYRRYVEENHLKMPPGPIWDSKWKKGQDLPIVNVPWEDAQAYCQWAGGRLPTEAEWEYAARAGSNGHVYPSDTEDSREKANFAGRKGNDRWDQETAPVRSFDPNAFRLYDMAGNVWEWVLDPYSADYYAHSPAVDPKGPESGKEHVARGGSFDSDPKEHLRISIRKAFGKGQNNIGFRCMIPDTPAAKTLLRGIE